MSSLLMRLYMTPTVMFTLLENAHPLGIKGL